MRRRDQGPLIDHQPAVETAFLENPQGFGAVHPAVAAAEVLGGAAVAEGAIGGVLVKAGDGLGMVAEKCDGTGRRWAALSLFRRQATAIPNYVFFELGMASLWADQPAPERLLGGLPLAGAKVFLRVPLIGRVFQ